MPKVWNNCLEGEGDIDLTQVPVLSRYQYLFSSSKFTGKLTEFFASLALHSKMEPLQASAYPVVFQNPQFEGMVYVLDEMTIDVQALVRELVKP
jgi:hypothetical protein